MSILNAADTLLSLSERIRSQSTLEAMSAECTALLSEFGAYHFAAGIFQSAERTVVAIDYPQPWVEHYFRRGYIDIDPTVNKAASHHTPYEWDFGTARGSSAGELFSDIYDFGVRRGLTVPIHTPTGATFVASFAATSAEIHRSERVLLSWVAAQFYEHYVEVIAPKPAPMPDLTPRERDCLTWVARGKSSWDVGGILGISENTVNFHLKNAVAKLGVKGRTLGVVKAITIGAIDP